MWAVWVEFDLELHVERMRRVHPDWSVRQLRNCLYWQAGVRKRLRHELHLFEQQHLIPAKLLQAIECPEACGVNVTDTMGLIGIELQWPPITKVVKVAIVGERKLST
jgi:hypothetical protein